MFNTPRSAKRRRLNSSESPSNDRSTRRSTKVKPSDRAEFEVIEVKESPIYDIDELWSVEANRSIPLRQNMEASSQAHDPTPEQHADTPTKSGSRARTTRRDGSITQSKMSTRASRRQHATDISGNEDKDMNLDRQNGRSDLDTVTSSAEHKHPGSARKSYVRETGAEALVSDAQSRKAPDSKPMGRRNRSEVLELEPQGDIEVDENAMDVDGKDLVPDAAFNGAGVAKNDPIASGQCHQVPDNQMKILRSLAMSKLSQRRRIPLINLDAEYAKVYQLLHATVTTGESNSLLLIGARGSGKTSMINSVLNDLSRSQKEHFHTVRLNGFMQTDDKIALREIWRQLGREMEISEMENGGGKSYADTLTMLLALLSHPEEIAGGRVDSGRVAKSIIFIMDEFDLFATHARQTLLYNLLDIAQSRKAPIAVIGLTTRIDVTEALEKRVKSRFSHRYVHLSLPKTLSEFVDVAKSALQVQPDELTIEEKAILFSGGPNSGSINTKSVNTNLSVSVVEGWNAAVETLFTSSSFLKSHVHPIYYTTKSIPALFANLLVPVSSLTALPEESNFTNAADRLLTPPDSNLHILPALSELALSLLIAACRLTIIHSTDTTNFPLAYAEYVSLASKARVNSAASGALASGSGSRVFGKAVARKEWEKLVGYGIVVPVASGAFGLGSVATGAGKGMELVRVDIALEEIPLSVEMSAVMEKWCLQI
ncbi:uncharacterized protein PV09_03292 [Verruconis gallopava]|uniref:Origin recognition complex subunit 4 n=1 Tax=Verruconis gallopava TaxID=253628 RepID=A0A0D1YZJ5_9PEZI|nr:uncharacterized protein PV09_03292 [Verruconis gallopava]KIW06127.1 hypothetical protein PV09_03292 [Verruconis gallopava]